ncbi:phospholipase D-like domain-containing protein [Streptomyces sp. NBC_01462]|uniref:phospholipase D-like domain-containing protein n=1 Tax=Streptomyces sp. NBC_01462 TaxID=2903876 RepID=UPI003FCD8298
MAPGMPWREIAETAGRGVCGDLLLEESTRASTAFVALPSKVAGWHRVASTGVLHTKLIAADRHTALLGSANLTDRALTRQHRIGGSAARPGDRGTSGRPLPLAHFTRERHHASRLSQGASR